MTEAAKKEEKKEVTCYIRSYTINPGITGFHLRIDLAAGNSLDYYLASYEGVVEKIKEIQSKYPKTFKSNEEAYVETYGPRLREDSKKA